MEKQWNQNDPSLKSSPKIKMKKTDVASQEKNMPTNTPGIYTN